MKGGRRDMRGVWEPSLHIVSLLPDWMRNNEEEWGESGNYETDPAAPTEYTRVYNSTQQETCFTKKYCDLEFEIGMNTNHLHVQIQSRQLFHRRE